MIIDAAIPPNVREFLERGGAGLERAIAELARSDHDDAAILLEVATPPLWELTVARRMQLVVALSSFPRREFAPALQSIGRKSLRPLGAAWVLIVLANDHCELVAVRGGPDDDTGERAAIASEAA